MSLSAYVIENPYWSLVYVLVDVVVPPSLLDGLLLSPVLTLALQPASASASPAMTRPNAMYLRMRCTVVPPSVVMSRGSLRAPREDSSGSDVGRASPRS